MFIWFYGILCLCSPTYKSVIKCSGKCGFMGGESMFLTIKMDLSNWKVLSVTGNEEIRRKFNEFRFIDDIGTFLHDKRNRGDVQGGFVYDIDGVDYRGVYVTSGNICDIVLVDRSVSFEDINGTMHDNLTGLGTKAKLIGDLDTLSLNSSNFQLYIFQVDGFKKLMEIHGIRAADRLIRDLVDRVINSYFSNTELYRFDDDTFAIVKEGLVDVKFGDRILKLFSEPFILENAHVYVSLNVGYIHVSDSYRFDKDAEDYRTFSADNLIDSAYLAMTSSKESGKNTCLPYSDSLKTRGIEALKMEGKIRDALKMNQFHLLYQPQFKLTQFDINGDVIVRGEAEEPDDVYDRVAGSKSDGFIVGAEALIRWVHPEDGPIYPDKFIPAAEQNGLIVPIGEWVVREACRQQREWIDAGVNVVRVGVNIGTAHFQKETFVSDIAEVLEEFQLDPSLIGLEITEGVAVEDVNDMVMKLGQLKELGIKVSIDDFGTGYSSLSYLKKFPIDTLKIDQSFVFNIATDKGDLSIIKAIIGLARDMNIKVIAEGVETTDAKDLLSKLDCSDMQGYLFSKPIDSSAFELILKNPNINPGAGTSERLKKINNYLKSL